MTTARDGSWITQHPARLCHRGRQAEATKSGNQSGLAKRHTPSRTSDGALTNRLLDVGSLAGCWQEVSDQLVEDEWYKWAVGLPKEVVVTRVRTSSLRSTIRRYPLDCP